MHRFKLRSQNYEIFFQYFLRFLKFLAIYFYSDILCKKTAALRQESGHSYKYIWKFRKSCGSVGSNCGEIDHSGLKFDRIDNIGIIYHDIIDVGITLFP